MGDRREKEKEREREREREKKKKEEEQETMTQASSFCPSPHQQLPSNRHRVDTGKTGERKETELDLSPKLKVNRGCFSVFGRFFWNLAAFPSLSLAFRSPLCLPLLL
jgi:hypothetical protein